MHLCFFNAFVQCFRATQSRRGQDFESTCNVQTKQQVLISFHVCFCPFQLPVQSSSSWKESCLSLFVHHVAAPKAMYMYKSGHIACIHHIIARLYSCFANQFRRLRPYYFEMPGGRPDVSPSQVGLQSFPDVLSVATSIHLSY